MSFNPHVLITLLAFQILASSFINGSVLPLKLAFPKFPVSVSEVYISGLVQIDLRLFVCTLLLWGHACTTICSIWMIFLYHVLGELLREEEGNIYIFFFWTSME